MADRGSFDDRLSTTVHAFADGARTQVDAVETAERAIAVEERRRRRGWARGLRTTPVWVLLMLALLLAFAWGVGVGMGFIRENRAPAVVPPVATPTAPAEAPSLAASPAVSLDPLRSAHVSGSPRLTLVSPGESSQTGDETRVTGIVYDLQEDVDDPRVAGSGTLNLNTSGTADTNDASGSIQIKGADGGWQGTCTGASWSAGQSMTLDCWLSGTGAYEGLTYYRYSLTSNAGNAFDGVVMSVPPPSP